MIGFEVNYNDSIISVPINDYCLTVIIESDSYGSSLKVSGSDHENNSIIWLDTKLNNNDSVKIKIKNIESVSPPIEIKDYLSAAAMSPEQKLKQYEQNKKTFLTLEKLLISKGLLPIIIE